jgi:hypothetical protein
VLPTVIVQLKTFIKIRRDPRDWRAEFSCPGKNLETNRGKFFVFLSTKKHAGFYYNPKLNLKIKSRAQQITLKPNIIKVKILIS